MYLDLRFVLFWRKSRTYNVGEIDVREKFQRVYYIFNEKAFQNLLGGYASFSFFSLVLRKYKKVENRWPSLYLRYQVCQELWPSLMFADEDFEPQNFWALSKSHVATTYLCMHFCSIYTGWSNQVKNYVIEVQFAKQDVTT